LESLANDNTYRQPTKDVGGRDRAAWLAVICVLLVLLVGAIESGKLSGFKNLEGSASAGVSQGEPLLYHPAINSTLGFHVTNGSAPVGAANALGVGGAGFPEIQPPAFVWWYAFVPIIIGTLATLYFLLTRAGGANVFDFRGALEELEKERSRIKMGWAGGMRNEILLRYYAVMLRVCRKIGLKESPVETPTEYLGRVADELGIERAQAMKFAQAFNRARYGLELTPEEASEASNFMEGFVDVIRSRAGVG